MGAHMGQIDAKGADRGALANCGETGDDICAHWLYSVTSVSHEPTTETTHAATRTVRQQSDKTWPGCTQGPLLANSALSEDFCVILTNQGCWPQARITEVMHTCSPCTQSLVGTNMYTMQIPLSVNKKTVIASRGSTDMPVQA